ncbi:right-handed parallel beta-helix repeat-containing protein [Brucepastera parasyntrophica]|uniref:right-handed parallel beta-helix repeat-containing protein n=1 Tax=Brucepastera parasyntrophica TaxID=2880008 RepID=UPI00210E8EF0|nr:right-handed parallel beta-helix repeat-containing protein [Brucepastera parasyntrophica]ULQ59479.1 right-handed parallel beta-helix repeat-containing protein [Brucepastera parasyntrophica]
MKKKLSCLHAAFIPALAAALLLTACNAFNVSVPEYLEEYTSNAAAESWRITTGSQTGPDSKKIIIPPSDPAEESSHTLISVRLRNPKKYPLALGLSRYDTAEGEYVSVAGEAEAEQTSADYITITVKDASIRDEFRFRLSMKTQDNLRTFADYNLPLIRCNVTPASADNLEVRNEAGTPTVYWNMNTADDYIDVNEVTVYLKAENTINTYMYTRETDSGPWKTAGGTELDYTDPSASLAFPAGMISQETGAMDTEEFEKYYNFAVVLKNSDGLEARNATPGFGWDVSPAVLAGIAQSDDNPARVKVTLIAQDGSLKADEILYTLGGDSTVHTYGNPFEAAIGTELVAWSTKSGRIPSRKTSRTLMLDTVVFVDENSTPAADDNYGFVPALPAPTIEAAIDLLKTADSASGTAVPRYVLLMSDVTSGNSGNTSALVEIVNYDKTLVIQPMAENDTVTIDAADSGRTMYISSTYNPDITLKNLIITGGSLSSDYGHGILLVNRGTLTLDNCTITDNGNGFGSGGGIALNGNWTLNIKGETRITENTAANGGGIYNRGGTVNIEDGTISGNGASMGGGIYNDGGAVNIENATISENNADQRGGGICIVAGGGGSVTLNGGTISGNETAGNGGGVYVGGDTFNMNGDLVTGNTAQNGGGVHIELGAFNMTGGVITGNEATVNGAGVCVNDGTFSMQGNAKVIMENPVYLKSGKTITLSGDFKYRDAIAKIQPEMYDINVRVLDGLAGYIADNHTSFAVEDQENSGSYLSWAVDKNGYLVKAIGISCDFVDGIYGLAFTPPSDGLIVDKEDTVNITVNRSSLPTAAGLSYTILIEGEPDVSAELLSGNMIPFTAPNTAGQHTVFVEIIVDMDSRKTAYSGSFVLTVRM